MKLLRLAAIVTVASLAAFVVTSLRRERTARVPVGNS